MFYNDFKMRGLLVLVAPGLTRKLWIWQQSFGEPGANTGESAQSYSRWEMTPRRCYTSSPKSRDLGLQPLANS
jgi:hypothetical protein